MDEDANSWLRRTRFSRTVVHRLDSVNFGSIYSTFEPEHAKYVNSSSLNPKSEPLITPKSIVRDEQKRLPIPHSQKEDLKKGIMEKLLQKVRFLRTKRLIKEYFDHGGRRISSVETVDDHRMVELSDLFIGLKFAHGAYSQIYHGMYKDRAVAVKFIRLPEDAEEDGMLAARLEKQFDREVSLLARLHHQNVIKFVAACRKPPVFCVITEYLSEGSLRAYLHKLELEKKRIPLQEIITIALEIARGMEYIHSQGIIHRDLKPENVIINNEFHLKIADFGIACEEASCDRLANDPGSYRWMAPEMIKHKSYGRRVDMYSFGLILLEMVAGTIPYGDMTPIQAAFAVANKNSRPAIPEDCPSAMRALIEQCWCSRPEKRPEFWQIVKVLENFQSLLATDGTLNLAPTCQDHKKGLLHWLQKLGPHKSKLSVN